MSFRPQSLHSQTTGFTLPCDLADIGVLFSIYFHQCGLRRAHTEGVGKQNRRFQRAIVDLHKAGGLAKAVDNMAGRQQSFRGKYLVRQQRR